MVVSQSMTGDEAYARRLAMSQGKAPVAPVPEPPASTQPAESGHEANLSRATRSQPQFTPQSQTQPFEDRELAYDPFAPPTSVPPPPTAQPNPGPAEFDEKFQERVKSSREAAAAVAARLALAASSSQGNPPSQSEEDTPAQSKK